VSLDADTLPAGAKVAAVLVGAIPRVGLAAVMAPREVVLAVAQPLVHLKSAEPPLLWVGKEW